MDRKILTPSQTRELIEAGASLLIAGDEALLRALPRGNWIAGTIPYFMGDDGGIVDRGVLYVDVLPDAVEEIRVRDLDAASLPQLAAEGFENGFTVLVLPAMTDVHAAFAQDSAEYEGLFNRPVVGWIAGVHLDDLGQEKPRVVDGTTGAFHEDHAVVLHARLADGVVATLDIVNVFAPDDGPTLTFDTTGFSVETVHVDGEPRNFAEWLAEVGHDSRLPLVADYFGAHVNVSIQAIAEDHSRVDLYAPVFEGMEYRLAAPVADYVREFESAVPADAEPVFACNCILNFLYSELEGKQTTIRGPITFGEIAYQLLNQTLVHLDLKQAA